MDSRNVWRCHSCGTFFVPNPPDYNCPNCRGAGTSPAKEFDREKNILWGDPSSGPKPRMCPKCGGAMRSGFLVERDSPTQTSTYGEGVYWSPEEYGFIGRRVALKAYACPDCGYVEQYVRFLEDDRDKILRAPTRREEQGRET